MRPADWMTAGPGGLPIPINVSWHLWPHCNLSCSYCYATFREVPGVLSQEQALRVLDELCAAGTEKVTFVGGEPTLCPHLPDLLRHAKDIGLVTMLVTNGTTLDADYQANVIPYLDWVCLSIDAADPAIMAAMGRGNARFHVLCMRRWEELTAFTHLRLKINTVVTRVNLHDDMRDLVRRLRPARWKAFQFLPVRGQNDEAVASMAVSPAEFAQWVDRHRDLDAEGLGPIAEDNGDLTGTYLMLDALGRFFHNKFGEHVYTDSLLDVGVWEAVRQVGWDTEGFLARDGIYPWSPVSTPGDEGG